MKEFYICGLWELEEAEKQGAVGNCTWCRYYGNRNFHNWCDKKKTLIDEIETDCEDWFVDTR